MTWEDPLVATTLAVSFPLLKVHPKFVNGTVEDPIPEKHVRTGVVVGSSLEPWGGSAPPSPPSDQKSCPRLQPPDSKRIPVSSTDHIEYHQVPW